MVLHPATRCGSPGDILQIGGKERPIRETALIKGADQVLPSFLLFFRIFFINPRPQERPEFRVTILGWQGLVQQLYGVRVKSEALALGLLSQALFQVWW